MEKNVSSKFNLEKLRINTSEMSSDVVQVLQVIPVRKPNKQEFVQAHPSEEYGLQVGIIQTKDDGEYYLIVNPDLFKIVSEIEPFHLQLSITRQGQLFIWPIKLQKPDARPNHWNFSAIRALNLAKKEWVKVVANLNAQSYEVFAASANLTAPTWPEKSFSELLEIAFNKNTIDSEDHIVIQKLKGLI